MQRSRTAPAVSLAAATTSNETHSQLTSLAPRGEACASGGLLVQQRAGTHPVRYRQYARHAGLWARRRLGMSAGFTRGHPSGEVYHEQSSVAARTAVPVRKTCVGVTLLFVYQTAADRSRQQLCRRADAADPTQAACLS